MDQSYDHVVENHCEVNYYLIYYFVYKILAWGDDLPECAQETISFLMTLFYSYIFVAFSSYFWLASWTLF